MRGVTIAERRPRLCVRQRIEIDSWREGDPPHVAPLPMPVGGDDAVLATLGAMALVTREDAQRERESDDLHWDLPDTLPAVFDVLKRMQFEEDPKCVERLQRPYTMLRALLYGRAPVGDCDDRAMLGAMLLKLAGFTTPVFIAMKPAGADRFVHVAPGVLLVPPMAYWPGNVLRGSLQEFSLLKVIDAQETDAPGRWPVGMENGEVLVWIV